MAAKGSRKLSFRHRLCVLGYLSGKTKRAAMDDVGFSPKSDVSTVFNRADVLAELEREQQVVLDKFEVSKDWVTEQLVSIAVAGRTLAKFKVVDPETGALSWDFRGATQEELGLIDTLSVSETTSPLGKTKKDMKITVPSRQSAIDSLCRIHGFNKDNLDIPGAMTLIDRLQRGRQRSSGKEEEGKDAEA